jgi:hypothetical protein
VRVRPDYHLIHVASLAGERHHTGKGGHCFFGQDRVGVVRCAARCGDRGNKSPGDLRRFIAKIAGENAPECPRLTD